LIEIRAILLDIEGTTTPIAFVYDVLFPYARAHLREYLRDRPDSDAINVLKQEWRVDADHGEAPAFTDHSIDAVATYVEWLMDRDRKSPGLKQLQGLVWERGYREGALKGDVFPDVPPALERWHQRGIAVAIYSSGSILAQRLLFSSTRFGDLTRLLSNYFDTSSGSKTSADSYRRIAASLECSTDDMLFVSDSASELEAARSGGCQVTLCVRPGDPALQAPEGIRVVHTFDEILDFQ